MILPGAALGLLGGGQLGRMFAMAARTMGYRVLAYSDPTEALRAAEAEPATIHLLLTDVVMPRMDGRELSEAPRRLRPDLKCVYMSGYPANVIARDGVLEPGVSYLQKPFTRAELAEKLRATLDG